MTTLEIYYSTPEGPRSSTLLTDEDALKVIGGFISKGINIVQEHDQLYLPWHSIIAIHHKKENK